MIEITGENLPQLYYEAIWKVRIFGVPEESRNGPVVTIEEPVHLKLHLPRERVLFDPVRNANPFFHVMEFVWMMSAVPDLTWIQQFNSRFSDYSDDGKTLPASYGYRWREHFDVDQILMVIDMLKKDPTTRRAVLGMWDPQFDLSSDPEFGNDKPCNTHIYFRYLPDRGLCMTVCNRSNDLIWGALGANAVHMTMLHELIATGAGLKVGTYNVLTNNLHMYSARDDYAEIIKTIAPVDPYQDMGLSTLPLLGAGATVVEFFLDAEKFVDQTKPGNQYRTQWFRDVAYPMYMAYTERKAKVGDGNRHIELIKAEDWRQACSEWVQRKAKATPQA